MSSSDGASLIGLSSLAWRNDERELAVRVVELRQQLSRSGPDELLVKFRQLAANKYWSIDQQNEIFKGPLQLVRRLEEHDCSVLGSRP